MHQFSDVRRALRRAVHIDYVSSVTKPISVRLFNPQIRVYVLSSSHHVVLGDEDDVGIAQLVKVLAGFERVRVQQRGVVPRALRLRALVGPLDLNVVFLAFGIPCEHVEANAAPLKALYRVLGLRLDNLQILLAEDDLQNQLDALRRVFKALRHEGVVHEPEVLDQRKTLRIHDVRRAPRPRLAGGGHFPSAVMLCLRHVFLVFPPEGTSPPSTAYFTLSPFLVSRDGRTKKLSVACRLCFWVSRRNGGASRPRRAARHYQR